LVEEVFGRFFVGRQIGLTRRGSQPGRSSGKTIERLDADYGIRERIRFLEGAGGLPFIEMTAAGARALVSVHGGQVLSYRPVREPEQVLFLSSKAHYQPGKAIRGGAPVCWPWFGPDPEDLGRPAHGIARNRLWSVSATEATPDGRAAVRLRLSDSEETRAIWPHAFDLALDVTVGEELRLELSTRNTGDGPFSITQALHTYFRVGDIEAVQVWGLEDTEYLDKLDTGTRKSQIGPVIFAEQVDRIYMRVPRQLVIEDHAWGRRIRILSAGSRTAVVWNPWERACARMPDLADQDYRRFVCVESTNVADDRVQVAPGAESRLSATFSVERG
jgi:glucose-6-phosphate 1-epimerase